MKKFFSAILAALMLVTGFVFPVAAEDATTPVTATDEVSFAVLSDEEAAYLSADSTAKTSDNGRYADGTKFFTYVYPVQNIQNADSVTWTARVVGQLQLDVSVDNTNWGKAFSCADSIESLEAVYTWVHGGVANQQNSAYRLATQVKTFDLTAAIKSVATSTTDKLYVRISDVLPYKVVQIDNNDGTYSYEIDESTEAGGGGQVNFPTSDPTNTDYFVKLAMSYTVDHTKAQPALGRTTKYSFTPTDSFAGTSAKTLLTSLSRVTTGTEYPYLYTYGNDATLHQNNDRYLCDKDGYVIYAFALEDGAVPTNMSFTARMGERLAVWITFDDPLSSSVTWANVDVKLEGEAAQTPPWGGYTVTTRALDLMDAYNELINQGARNAGENKLYLKIGHYGSNATSDKGNTANSKGDGMISKGEKATFSCDYVWSTEYMPADKAFGFTQGALELTNDFNINYEAVAASCYSNVSLYAGYASKTQQAITPTVNGSTLSFAFDNIPAQCLADDILTTLAADYAANDSTRSAVANLTYSVRDYCEYMLNASSGDATFATLLSDVLAYGAAAQQYANYKTDDLATSVDATLTPSTFDASLVKGVRGVSGTASNIVDWKSATLKLDTTMTIQMTFAATDISDLTVGVQVGDRSEDTIASFVSLGNNQYRISYEVMASEFADTLTAKFYVGGEQIGRVLSYSVNGYVNNKLTSATGAYKTLLEAIANYGISVDNYIGEHPELMGEGRNEENVLASAKTNYVSTAEFKRAIALNNDDTNLTLLKNVMNKAKAGEAITVATIGGSVTYGTGASETGKGSALRDTASYSALFRDWWKTTFPKSNVTHVNAGIGSTTSHLGVHRLQDHVLDYNPDVCIVEFSVNDFTNDWYGESYESLVAKLLDNDVAVILLFMVKESGSSTQAVNAATGAKYHLPMISYGDAIMPTIESGEHVWKDFSEDTVHPNLYGHAYAGELLWKYLNTVYAYTPNEVTVVNDKTGLEDTPYYNAALYGPLDIAATGSGAFTIDTSVTVGGLSGAWVVDSASTAETKEITFKAKFSQLGAFYDRNKTTDTAKGLADCEVYIDGVKVVTLYGSNSNEHMSTHIHTSDGVTEHTVTFRIVNSDTTEGFTLYRLLITE